MDTSKEQTKEEVLQIWYEIIPLGFLSMIALVPSPFNEADRSGSYFLSRKQERNLMFHPLTKKNSDSNPISL